MPKRCVIRRMNESMRGGSEKRLVIENQASKQAGGKTARNAIQCKTDRSVLQIVTVGTPAPRAKLIGLGGQALPRLSGDFQTILRCLCVEIHPMVMGLRRDGMGSC